MREDVAVSDPRDAAKEILSWLRTPADEVDLRTQGAPRMRMLTGVAELNANAASGDAGCFHLQQFLLAKIYDLELRLSDTETAEGSTFLHEVTRLLEQATADAEDAALLPGQLAQAPSDPTAYVSWLKNLARGHRVFKHPYYMDFIRNHADGATCEPT